MIHQMKLRDMPFNEIERGEKTVELRLYDEKRKTVKLGDTLVFTNADKQGVQFCKVIGLHRYSSFEALYGEISVEKYGHSGTDMSVYYSAEEQEKYGVVGIEFVRDEIKNELYSMHEEKYRDFSSSLIPVISKNSIMGVRIPELRRYAMELIKEGRSENFIKDIPHEYFEENALHGFIIESIKDFSECIGELERFLPYVDNWSVCDSVSPKVFKKHKAELLEHIKKWLSSEQAYTVRYGIKMLMCHYLEEDFSPEYPRLVAEVKSEEYYVNMMRAWYFATALAKRWEDIIPYIENGILDTWTHNKTIQKARESYRITPEKKEYLKSLYKH